MEPSTSTPNAIEGSKFQAQVQISEGKKVKPSYRSAIDEKCKDCAFDPKDNGSWRQQIGACNIKSCALYELRPLPIKEKHSWQ